MTDKQLDKLAKTITIRDLGILAAKLNMVIGVQMVSKNEEKKDEVSENADRRI